jgi:hypothetical protein
VDASPTQLVDIPFRSQPVNVLWTGGWDSTFRVLELTLGHHLPVQPWYFVDEERGSTATERRTMAALRSDIAERDPLAAHLIRPTQEIAVSSIVLDPRLREAHGSLRIGSQYLWLASFLEREGMEGFELGAVRGGGHLYRILWEEVEEAPGPTGRTYRLREDVRNPNLELFRRFAFPLLPYSKPDLRARAEAMGWMDLMRRTWFCFSPRGEAPCGMCAPCLVAIQGGMAWRIPWHRRIRPRLRLLKRRVTSGTRAF